MNRGDIVLVDFPYSDTWQSKHRPAVVVQDDHYNQLLSKTVIALITGNTKRRDDPAHLLIDPAIDPDSGLVAPSLVSCPNLFTIKQVAVIQTLGSLSESLLTQLDACLIEALGIARP